jgi:hypothetical protein
MLEPAMIDFLIKCIDVVPLRGIDNHAMSLRTVTVLRGMQNGPQKQTVVEKQDGMAESSGDSAS